MTADRTPEYRAGKPARAAFGREFEEQVVRELNAAGIPAKLVSERYFHSDIELVGRGLFIEVKRRNGKPRDPLWYPQDKLREQLKSSRPVLILHSYTDHPGILYTHSHHSRVRHAPLALNSPHTDNVELRMDDMHSAPNAVEATRRYLRWMDAQNPAKNKPTTLKVQNLCLGDSIEC